MNMLYCPNCDWELRQDELISSRSGNEVCPRCYSWESLEELPDCGRDCQCPSEAIHDKQAEEAMADALRDCKPGKLRLDDITDVELENVVIDHDYWMDVYISAATWKSTGTPLTDPELDKLNDNADFVYKAIQDYLY